MDSDKIRIGIKTEVVASIVLIMMLGLVCFLEAVSVDVVLDQGPPSELRVQLDDVIPLKLEVEWTGVDCRNQHLGGTAHFVSTGESSFPVTADAGDGVTLQLDKVNADESSLTLSPSFTGPTGFRWRSLTMTLVVADGWTPVVGTSGAGGVWLVNGGRGLRCVREDGRLVTSFSQTWENSGSDTLAMEDCDITFDASGIVPEIQADYGTVGIVQPTIVRADWNIRVETSLGGWIALVEGGFEAFVKVEGVEDEFEFRLENGMSQEYAGLTLSLVYGSARGGSFVGMTIANGGSVGRQVQVAVRGTVPSSSPFTFSRCVKETGWITLQGNSLTSSRVFIHSFGGTKLHVSTADGDRWSTEGGVAGPGERTVINLIMEVPVQGGGTSTGLIYFGNGDESVESNYDNPFNCWRNGEAGWNIVNLRGESVFSSAGVKTLYGSNAADSTETVVVFDVGSDSSPEGVFVQVRPRLTLEGVGLEFFLVGVGVPSVSLSFEGILEERWLGNGGGASSSGSVELVQLRGSSGACLTLSGADKFTMTEGGDLWSEGPSEFSATPSFLKWRRVAGSGSGVRLDFSFAEIPTSSPGSGGEGAGEGAGDCDGGEGEVGSSGGGGGGGGEEGGSSGDNGSVEEGSGVDDTSEGSSSSNVGGGNVVSSGGGAKKKLRGGAVAGIAVGCAAFGALVVGVGLFLGFRVKKDPAVVEQEDKPVASESEGSEKGASPWNIL